MSIAHHHAKWLSLVEISGPFLSMPVLLRVFPQGLRYTISEAARRVVLDRLLALNHERAPDRPR